MGVKWRESFDLIAKIRAGVHKKPTVVVRRDRKLSLRPWLPGETPLAHPPAIEAGTIPLRKSSSGSCAKDSDAHPRLYLWICVARDFATETDFLKLRCGPFHTYRAPLLHCTLSAAQAPFCSVQPKCRYRETGRRACALSATA